jgi:hypothetical protein
MGIMPDAYEDRAPADLGHLAVSHHLGPAGEVIQLRDTTQNLKLVDFLTLEDAAGFIRRRYLTGDYDNDFTTRLNQAIAEAIYAMVARTEAGAL